MSDVREPWTPVEPSDYWHTTVDDVTPTPGQVLFYWIDGAIHEAKPTDTETVYELPWGEFVGTNELYASREVAQKDMIAERA